MEVNPNLQALTELLSWHTKGENHVGVAFRIELADFSHAQPRDMRPQRVRIVRRDESDPDVKLSARSLF
jgi:hypothetical protein